MNTNTANSNYAHPEFDELMKDKSNQNCFDCGRGLVSWASVNNSVFLCINCAGIHRGFGVTVSYIRSITIDSWNDNQVSFIKAGGNERLKNLLNMYDVPADFPPENLYKTKLLEYYRNSIKSEVTKGVAPIPPKPEEALTSTVKERENTNNYSSVSSDVEDFGNIKNNYKSEKITKKNSIFSSVTGMLNGAYEKSKQVATNMKDKVVEMDIGTKIKTTGAKTVDILKDTTHVVVEKSTQVAVRIYFVNF